MTEPDHQGACNLCGIPCFWQECPTGGWWIHDWPSKEVESLFKDKANDLEHEADPGWFPQEEMDVNGHWCTLPAERVVK